MSLNDGANCLELPTLELLDSEKKCQNRSKSVVDSQLRSAEDSHFVRGQILPDIARYCQGASALWAAA